MLSSITPLGERGRNNRWGLTVSAYLVGSTAGGAVVGVAFGALGQAARAAWPGPGDPPAAAALCVLAAVALGGLVLEAGWRGARLPTLKRQVDERWLDGLRGWVYGIGYGFQLGLGVVTIVTSALTYTTVAAALLSASWVGGLMIGTTFGLMRALPILLTARVQGPAELRALHVRNQRWGVWAGWLAVGAQGLVAVGALSTAVAVH